MDAISVDRTTSPYSVAWNTAASSNGPHTLKAVAYDAAGNSTTSTIITVTVDNATPNPPVITGPTITNNTTPTINLTATDVGGSGISGFSVDFFDAFNLRCGTEFRTGNPTTSTLWWRCYDDSYDGDFTFVVKAVDNAGNYSAPMSFVTTIDTIPPGAVGGETVNIGINTNKGTRNYKVRPNRNEDVELIDNQLYNFTELFSDSNFPTFRLNCPGGTGGCQTSGSVLMDGKIKKETQTVYICSQFFESGCTASFSSADLRLMKTRPDGSPLNNNAIWSVDISFLKDLAGNSPPVGTWRTFDVFNKPPVINP